MPLGSNVQISFSQIQSEFGGTGEIRLSDYTSTYAYSGLELSLNNLGNINGSESVYILSDSTYTTARTGEYNVKYGLDPITVFVGMKLKIKQTSTFNAGRIYLSSSPEKGESNILSTGVTFTGTGLRNSGDFIVLDTSSYFPNDSQYDRSNNATVSAWLKTDANCNIYVQSVGFGGAALNQTQGNSVPIKIISRPSIERVRLMADYCDITWPANLTTGSEIVKLGSGAFYFWDRYNSAATGRLIKNGQNLSLKMAVSALPSVYSTGSYIGTYIATFAISGTDITNYSFGAVTTPGWFSSNGPVVSFIGGSGLSNTADNVAQCIVDTFGSTPRAADVTGISGLTASASRSGNIVTITLYNNTGSDRFLSYFTGATDNSGAFLVGYYNPSLVFTYTNATSGWSSSGQTQAFGSKLVGLIHVRAGNSTTTIGGQYTFDNAANASSVTTTFLNDYLTKINTPSERIQYGYKTIPNGYRMITGQNLGPMWANVYYVGPDPSFAFTGTYFDTQKVSMTGNYLTPGAGSSNFVPIISNYSNNNVYIDTTVAGNYQQNYNHKVKLIKRNMSLSDYWSGYGNVALGL